MDYFRLIESLDEMYNGKIEGYCIFPSLLGTHYCIKCTHISDFIPEQQKALLAYDQSKECKEQEENLYRW